MRRHGLPSRPSRADQSDVSAPPFNLSGISLDRVKFTRSITDPTSAPPFADSNDFTANSSNAPMIRRTFSLQTPQPVNPHFITFQARSNNNNNNNNQNENKQQHLTIAQVRSLKHDEFVVSALDSHGVCGVYHAQDSRFGQKWIFKPQDEEAYTTPRPSPTSDVGTGGHETDVKKALLEGLVWGDSSSKEVAAFVLDHESHAGVPLTVGLRVQIAGVAKYGSLQAYQGQLESAEDLSSSLFDVEDVHRIGSLDVRLVNLDRHLGNLLVARVPAEDQSIYSQSGSPTPVRGSESSVQFPPNSTSILNNHNTSTSNGGKENMKMKWKYKLIPIDHGFVLPDYRNVSQVKFEWLHWSQCKKPFSSAQLSYIKKLDAWRDAEALRLMGVNASSVITFVLATLLLKHGAASGLTLFQIARCQQRSLIDPDVKSEFECIIADSVRATVAAWHASTHHHKGSDNNNNTNNPSLTDAEAHTESGEELKTPESSPQEPQLHTCTGSPAEHVESSNSFSSSGDTDVLQAISDSRDQRRDNEAALSTVKAMRVSSSRELSDLSSEKPETEELPGLHLPTESYRQGLWLKVFFNVSTRIIQKTVNKII